MMGKLMIDSVLTWATAYKLDGFRFDLMGHQPKALMVELRQRLDRLTLRKDGVDGKKIYLYGEGWNFGEVADDALFTQATQQNMAGTGIGTFNDRLRDAVRGGGPFDEDPRIQGFGSGLYTDPNGVAANGTTAEQKARLLLTMDQIKVGLAGNLKGYTFTDRTGATVTGADVEVRHEPDRVRRPAAGVDQLRRRARQRDALRRAHLQAAGQHLDGRPDPDADPGPVDDGLLAGHLVLARRERRAAQQVVRRQQLRLR